MIKLGHHILGFCGGGPQRHASNDFALAEAPGPGVVWGRCRGVSPEGTAPGRFAEDLRYQ
jgi:hypothetical protein